MAHLRSSALGIDKVQVRRSGSGWELINETGQSRSLRVVFDDGIAQDVQIKDKAFVSASGASR